MPCRTICESAWEERKCRILRKFIIPGISCNSKVNSLHWRFSPGQAKQATHTRRDAKDEREKPDKVDYTSQGLGRFIIQFHVSELESCCCHARKECGDCRDIDITSCIPLHFVYEVIRQG